MFDLFFSSFALVLMIHHGATAYAAPLSPPKPTAIVFGAGLASKKTPSVVLKDRLDTAYDLYHKGVVSSVFLSGDSTIPSHDEVGVMKTYLLKKGIPNVALIQDPQGVDTYSTCIHAKKDLDSLPVILVTQSFHMPRAQYLCEGVGLKVTQAIADKREYKPENAIREKKAMAKAWLQINTDIPADQMQRLEDIVE